MDVECQAITGTSVCRITHSTSGWVDANEDGKVNKDHNVDHEGYLLTLNDEEPILPGEDFPRPLNEDSIAQDTMASLMYDKTCRRSSLGADSLLDQDFSEDGALDCEGASNPTATEALLGSQYADDIYILKKKLESLYHPTNCMADQPQVTEYMRCTLVHWLIKVNHQLQFGPETVFLAVNISDRFLAVTPLAQDCLQLLAVASLFIAAKMEESIVPGISELVAMCGGTYKPHHFRRMEVFILSTLQFVLYGPTGWYFIEHLTLKASQTCSFDRRVVSVARYVLETCLSNYEISQFPPSVQAAGAMLLSVNVVPCSPIHTETLQGLLHELHCTSERKDAVICSALMTRYMAPFLSCIDPEHQHFNSTACDSPTASQEPVELTHSQSPLAGPAVDADDESHTVVS